MIILRVKRSRFKVYFQDECLYETMALIPVLLLSLPQIAIENNTADVTP